MRKQGSHELGGNFFDCQEEKEALVQENEIVHALAEPGCLYSDPTFPASAKSLYRTPQQPPQGAMPPSLAVWARISQLEVRGCHSPVTFPTDGTPSVAVQGALGDSWLVSALNILLTVPETLKKVLVSDRHRDKGIYTLKLYKEGSWRYLHVDDRLPCSPPHALHFCSTRDPNQVWAPLIEKAFAKIHRCYENLGRGSIEQGLRGLTGAPLLRISLERLLPSLPSVERGGTVSVTAEDETAERRRHNLWSEMKSLLKTLTTTKTSQRTETSGGTNSTNERARIRAVIK